MGIKPHPIYKMRKLISHIIGMGLGALALLPSFCDDIPIFNLNGTVGSVWRLELPIVVNSFLWVYLVIFIGLLCIYLWFCNIHPALKVGSTYLYVSSFYSAAPYISFNALLLVIPAVYLYVLIKNVADKKIIINWIVALFWMEVLICILQFLGKDVLMNFDRPQRIFLGTVMQHMRAGCLFAIMAPFLLLKNKLYIIPLMIVSILVYSSSLALALCAGVFIYFIISNIKLKTKVIIISSIIILAIGHSLYNITSFRVAFTVGRIPCWIKIFMTGFGCTYHTSTVLCSDINLGLLSSIKGHGLNMFQCLYPVLIGDGNPFAQCHNDWLQLFWETGFIGLGIALLFVFNIIRKLYKIGSYIWIAGIVIISVNMFFAFPMFMLPQTPFLVLTFFALCERETKKEII